MHIYVDFALFSSHGLKINLPSNKLFDEYICNGIYSTIENESSATYIMDEIEVITINKICQSNK